ncbi:hypothetical protein L208DRAFT_1381038 [Tricholoma matsutake]|nr:hypothetical protein L208DRAFT_1381038 [Tricholoma matsutake 945]
MLTLMALNHSQLAQTIFKLFLNPYHNRKLNEKPSRTSTAAAIEDTPEFPTNKLSKWSAQIIPCHDQSVNITENHEFHNLLHCLGEDPDDITPHSRSICQTTNIIALLSLVIVLRSHWHGFTDGRFPLILWNAIGPLKVVSDIWSRLSYLSTTLHLATPTYLDVEYLELNSALVAFIPLVGCHRLPSEALSSGCDDARGMHDYPGNIIIAKGTNGDNNDDNNQGER